MSLGWLNTLTGLGVVLKKRRRRRKRMEGRQKREGRGDRRHGGVRGVA